MKNQKILCPRLNDEGYNVIVDQEEIVFQGGIAIVRAKVIDVTEDERFISFDDDETNSYIAYGIINTKFEEIPMCDSFDRGTIKIERDGFSTFNVTTHIGSIIEHKEYNIYNDSGDFSHGKLISQSQEKSPKMKTLQPQSMEI